MTGGWEKIYSRIGGSREAMEPNTGIRQYGYPCGRCKSGLLGVPCVENVSNVQIRKMRDQQVSQFLNDCRYIISFSRIFEQEKCSLGDRNFSDADQ